MGNLIKFELRKMFRQKTFYVCAGVILIVVILNVLVQYLIERVSNSIFGGFGDFIASSYSGSDFITMAPSLMQMIILFPIFITLFVCNDFSEGTIKNVISRGFTRSQVYFGKFVASATAGLIYMVWSMLIGFVTGSLIWGVGDGFGIKMLGSIGILMLLTVAYVAFDCFIAFLFRKKAGSLAVGIAVSYVVQLICMITDAILEVKEMELRISGYTITSSIQMVGTDGPSLSALIVAIIYIALFTFGGWLIFRNKEV